MGYEVITRYGPDRLPHADIVILHVDQTVVPRAYQEALADYPVVVNRNIIDVSRGRYSEIRVSRDSGYRGAVIVKTNANYGGLPEHNANERTNRFSFFRWRTRKFLNPLRYPVFSSSNEVPPGVWKNPDLIVEKFLPEKEGNEFFVRYWAFFGDRSDAGRFGSSNPIIKFRNRTTEYVPIKIPEELREKRKELHMDFGRFDFVVHDNKVVLFDVNKTLGARAIMTDYADALDELALGIESF